MKKTINFLIIVMLTSLLLTACSDTSIKTNSTTNQNIKTSYNPFDLADETNNSIEFQYGPVNAVDELAYTGIPIENEYFYDNTGDIDCKLGFMIFIDGIPQPYKVNNEDNEEIMHEFAVQKRSKTQFKISFKPTVGKKGDKLGLYVVTILNPTFAPSQNRPIFGNNHALSQNSPVTLKYLESVNSPELKTNNNYFLVNITDEIRNEFLGNEKDKNEDYDSQESNLFHLKFNDDYKEQKIEIKKNSSLELTLECLCLSDDSKYRTTVFIDNKQVKMTDGKEYLDMQLKKGMLTRQNFEVDINGLTGSHILSVISGPIGDDFKLTNPVEQSDCRLLIVGD